MAALVWVMVGLAIWHFTIFVDDKFWGGIVGAFLAALIGSALFGFVVSGFDVPGNDDISIVTALEGIPGGLLGLGVAWAVGSARERGEPAHP